MVESYRPKKLKEALTILKEREPLLFAGGTDIMVAHRGYTGTELRISKTLLFVDKVEEITEIFVDRETLSIGAAVTVAAILQQKETPQLLKSALQNLAAPGIRNRATLGGNLGNGSPAADSLPPLYVLNGTVTLASLRGKREVAIANLFLGPGKTTLKKDELITHINLPLVQPKRLFYRKVGARKANALSKLSVAGAASVEGERLTDFRIAFGAVGPKVVRERGIEESLIGIPLKEINREVVLESYCRAISPIDDQRSTAAYRRQVALNLLKKFLLQLY